MDLAARPPAQVVAPRLDAGPHRYALVVARWNELITARLAEGATEALLRHGAGPENIARIYVPGAFEIPLAAQTVARTRRFAALVCLGCLIRGQTPHFDHLAAEVTRSLARVSLEGNLPVGLGVITADTLEQAIERCGGKHGNKGAEAALAAIEMVQVLAALAAGD